MQQVPNIRVQHWCNYTQFSILWTARGTWGTCSFHLHKSDVVVVIQVLNTFTIQTRLSCLIRNIYNRKPPLKHSFVTIPTANLCAFISVLWSCLLQFTRLEHGIGQNEVGFEFSCLLPTWYPVRDLLLSVTECIYLCLLSLNLQTYIYELYGTSCAFLLFKSHYLVTNTMRLESKNIWE